VLAAAIAFSARRRLSRGFRDCEISMPGAAWIAPLLSRSIAEVTGIPLGPLVLLAFHVSHCGGQCWIVPAPAASHTRDLT
jgi:alpha-1,2-mannosyltransferase